MYRAAAAPRISDVLDDLSRVSQPAIRRIGRSGRVALGDLDRQPDLDRVVDRILAPLEPAAVVHRDPLPTLEIGIEPGLAGTPAGAAVERDPLVGSDPGFLPVGRDLRVGTHGVVDVAVVLHVVGVGPAVAPDIALDPAGRADVVVAADVTDVLAPGPDADEG